MKSGCKKGEKEKTVTETQKNTTVLIKRQRYFLFALLNIYNLIACIGDSLYQCFIAEDLPSRETVAFTPSISFSTLSTLPVQ